jgi:hypothetical protein
MDPWRGQNVKYLSTMISRRDEINENMSTRMEQGNLLGAPCWILPLYVFHPSKLGRYAPPESLLTSQRTPRYCTTDNRHLILFKYPPWILLLSFAICNKFILVRFEVFTAVTMNKIVFQDVTPCGSCKNRRFGGT